MINIAVVLTNAGKYITYGSNHKIIKTSSLSNAYNFITVSNAKSEQQRCKNKCKGFTTMEVSDNLLSKPKTKRIQLSKEKRLQIYQKTKGRCYLCGESLDLDNFEIEHQIPLAKGGTNDVDNLFCSCHFCNHAKDNLYLQDFFTKIIRIVIRQSIYNNSFRYKLKRREVY